ncbi:hypothetical protein [Agaribacterium sp. ZY112]|uniref:hypothetical protein n=1 Tax=Agaribacterium sp. ZY112 TaxID=3233574 RepID=UPI003523B774
MKLQTLYMLLLTSLLAACDYLPYEAKIDFDNSELKDISAHTQAVHTAVLKAFETHNVVAIGDYHWNTPVMEAITQLVTQPKFNSKIQHIVVEFGNSRHQDLLNRYLEGKDASTKELEKVYRDSLFFTAWMPTVYQNFFATVRQHNLSVDASQRIKITLAEEAFNWEKTTEHNQWKKAASTKTDHFFSTVKQSIDKKEKTLMVFGAFHIIKLPTSLAKNIEKEQLPLVTRIELAYPGEVYTVWPLTDPTITQALAELPEPSIISVTDSALKDVKFIDMLPKARIRLSRLDSRDLLLSDLIDAVLFVGQTQRKDVLPESVYQDKQWLEEMDRRINIIGGKMEGKYRAIIESSAALYSK